MRRKRKSPRCKRKASWRVGQVVCLPKGDCNPRDRYGRILRKAPDFQNVWETTDGLWLGDQIRKQTRRERS